MNIVLSSLAAALFAELVLTLKAGLVKTEEPLQSSLSRELMAAGLVSFRKDDGLWTTYALTVKGARFAASFPGSQA